MPDTLDERPAPGGPADIKPVSILDEMKRSYLDYAMSVIVSRALPDVRDGLKPVHRRILYAMHELNFTPDRPYNKSARIVGDVIGKYHPHGDLAIYDALVRMAQDFSMRAPLIDGQGNFGSVDGDPPAAYRYTEARLDRVALALLDDLDKDTVDFQPNYDEKELEPVVLPARFPNLLVNGAGGIAVGMATNIPPHNLGETIDGLLAMMDRPDITLDELMEHHSRARLPDRRVHPRPRPASAPPTRPAAARSSCAPRSQVEELRKDREALIVSEIPYQVNKATLIERIAELVREKRIEGISDLRDESDRDGMRIVIETQARRGRRRGAQSALALHRAAIELRRQHDRAERRPAGNADADRHAARLPRFPRGRGHAAHQVSARPRRATAPMSRSASRSRSPTSTR